MRVLAVDPGYDRLGVAVMENQNGKEILLHSDCITTDKKLDIPERLFRIGTEFTSLLKQYEPDTVAIETLFFNKNQKTAIAVAEARGLIIYLAKLHKAGILEYSPQQIKVAITGYGNSDKQAVAEMLKHIVPTLPTKALDDEYDAIAIGVTGLAHNRQ